MARPNEKTCPLQAAQEWGHSRDWPGKNDIDTNMVRLFQKEKKIRKKIESEKSVFGDTSPKKTIPQPMTWRARLGNATTGVMIGMGFLAAWSHPWLVPAVVFSTFVVIAIIYSLFGHDRVAELAIAWHRRIAQRNPDRAEALRLFGKRMAGRVEWFANCMPESWTKGLYIPDFEPTEFPGDRLDADPFERLARELQDSQSPQEA